MGEGGYLSPYGWGRLASNLLEHELAKLLSQADVKTLSEAEAKTVMYEQFRSFMALKSTLKSYEPRSALLRPAHEALLNFGARLFMVAHQALVNTGKAEAEELPTVRGNPIEQHIAPVPSVRFRSADKLFTATRQFLLNSRITKARRQPTPNDNRTGQHIATVSSKQFVLEWQLVRLKAAKERLILQLADLSEKDKTMFGELRLAEAVRAEVESARLRVSDVWEEILKKASGSTVPQKP